MARPAGVVMSWLIKCSSAVGVGCGEAGGPAGQCTSMKGRQGPKAFDRCGAACRRNCRALPTNIACTVRVRVRERHANCMAKGVCAECAAAGRVLGVVGAAHALCACHVCHVLQARESELDSSRGAWHVRADVGCLCGTVLLKDCTCGIAGRGLGKHVCRLCMLWCWGDGGGIGAAETVQRAVKVHPGARLSWNRAVTSLSGSRFPACGCWDIRLRDRCALCL